MRRRITPITTTLVVGACIYMLWYLTPDLLYAFQGDARDLGPSPSPSALHTDEHVRLRGKVQIATPADYQGEKRDLVLIADAPVAVFMRTGASAEAPGEVVEVTGRLVRADRLRSLYAGNAWEQVARFKGLAVDQLYVLLDGVHPAVPWKTMAWYTLFLVMLSFSLWRLVRALRPARSVS